MEDAKILDLYFARNEEAIRQTDAAYGRRLFALADRILQDAQDSEESVSDTYLKTWETIPPSRPAYFYAYLRRSADISLWVNWIGKQPPNEKQKWFPQQRQ